MVFTSLRTVQLTLLEAIDTFMENAPDDLPVFRGARDGSEADIRTVSEVGSDGLRLELTDGTKFKITVTKIL